MARRTILLDTLTRHFITFAKTMGFFPQIVSKFKQRAEWESVNFYEKRSFYEYIRRCVQCKGYGNRVLNEYSIKSIYFDEFCPSHDVWITSYEMYSKNVKEGEVLLDLFMSYLRDKKISRYIKIIID